MDINSIYSEYIFSLVCATLWNPCFILNHIHCHLLITSLYLTHTYTNVW